MHISIWCDGRTPKTYLPHHAERNLSPQLCLCSLELEPVDRDGVMWLVACND